MNRMIRTECVLCLQKSLKSFVILNNFPIKCCSDVDIDNPITWNMELGTCTLCGSVQQLNLLDPSILYGGKYPLDTSYSKDWLQHYDQFATFIKKNISNNNQIVEIGSSSQILLDRLYDSYNNYTVFDFSLDTIKDYKENIKYVEGNCETYQFSIDDVIIMSHVFEHLYNPYFFINNCMSNNVNKIILSIPNMNDNTRIHITREHTFTYNDSDILYMFGKHKYKCVDKQFYKKDHSIFYYFQLTDDYIAINRDFKHDNYELTKQFLTKKLTVPINTYLMGAGYFSQCVYNNITNKENIIGIIDNDQTKQNRYFYNTSLLIKPFNILKDLEDGHVIVLANKYWTEEAIDHIYKINKNIKIIQF